MGVLDAVVVGVLDAFLMGVVENVAKAVVDLAEVGGKSGTSSYGFL